MIEQIGSYVVNAEIGQGGMGKVFRARDPSGADMGDVAIKILLTEGDPDLLGRFRSEAETTARLQHKNIVRVYKYGEQDGRPYLVMEYLEGKTLHAIIKEHAPLTLLEKVGILYQAAQGLQYAHSKNVIHRDIKPSNIMMIRDGTVKIMDFGIARVTGRDSTRRTNTGFVLGTIPYMSPEQLRGADADVLSDLFAFGDVCYELLTGVHPFQTDDPGTMLYRIVSADPRPIRELAPGVPDALAYVVQMALAKDREIRYQSLRDVLLDLEPILVRLRQEEASAIVAEARTLADAGDVDGALAKVKHALELDTMNEAGRQLREELQEKRQRGIVRSKIEALLREADALMAQARYADALPVIENVLRLDKSDGGARSRMETVNQHLESVRRSARLSMEAWRDIQQGDFTAAFLKATEAIEADPANQDAANLLKQIPGLVEEREQARVIQGVQAAEGLAAAGKFEQAHELLNRIRPRPSARELVECARVRVEQARLLSEQRLEFELLVATAREHLRDCRFDDARNAVEAARAKAVGPADVDVLNELAGQIHEADRASRLAVLQRRVTEMIASRRYSEARAELERAAAEFPGDALVAGLRQTTTDAEAAWQRAVGIGNFLREAKALRKEGRFDEALDLIGAGLTRFPGESALQELAVRLKEDRARQRHEAALAEVLEEARRRIELGRHEAAIALLTANLSRFASEPAFVAMMAAAKDAWDSHCESQFVKEALARVEHFKGQNEWSAALRECEQSLARYPHREEFRAAAAELTDRIEYESRLEQDLGEFQALVNQSRWPEGAHKLAALELLFPAEPRIEPLRAILEDARAADLRTLSQAVCASLERRRYGEAAELLKGAQGRLGAEDEWRALSRKLEGCQEYERSLEDANRRERRGDLDGAEGLLTALMAGNPPDGRAAQFRQAVREKSERKRREEEERARLKAEADAREAARLADERKRREEEERKRREGEERARLKAETDAREMARLEVERKRAEETERKRVEEIERRRRDEQTTAIRVRPVAEKAPAPVDRRRPHAKSAPRPASPLFRPRVLAAAGLIAVIAGGYSLIHRLSAHTEHLDQITIVAKPASLMFNHRAGSPLPPSQTIDFGDALVSFAASPADSWLKVSPAAGEQLAKLSVEIDPSHLKPGTYRSEIRLSWRRKNVAGPESIPVKLEVESTPEPVSVVLRPSSLSFQLQIGKEVTPAPKSITVTGAPADKLALAPSESWVHVERRSGQLSVTVQPSGLGVGPHSAILRVTAPGASPLEIPISLTIQRAEQTKVVDGVDRLIWSGTLPPGGILTIRGATWSIGDASGPLTGGELPQTNAEVVGLSSENCVVDVDGTPSARNGYRLKIRNKGTEPQTRLTVVYRQVQ